jgi:hypothetical protein
VPVVARWEKLSVMSENLISVKHQAPFQVFDLYLEEHDAICDLMEEVVGHTSLTTLEDLFLRTHGNTLNIYAENDLDEVRSVIPDSMVKLATLTEDEMLSLAWEIIQAVKEMRAQSIERLKVIK